jgi:cell division initiation protein
METTPNEMRNHQFSTSFRGFNKAEVNAFKESAAAALQEAVAQILKLTEARDKLEARYSELKNLQDTIKMAVIEAQKNADRIVANAKKEGELIINEAKQRRDKVIEEKYNKLSELEGRIKEIEFTRKSFYNKLRGEIATHLKLVDSIFPAESGAEQPREKPVEQPPVRPEPPTPPPESTIQETQTPVMERPEPPGPPTPEPDRQIAEPSSPESPDTGPSPEPEKSEEKASESRRPRLEMNDEDIDRLVDQFGEMSQEEEKVKDGQPQGKDF